MDNTSSWLDEFDTRIAELDAAHLRRRRRVVQAEAVRLRDLVRLAEAQFELPEPV